MSDDHSAADYDEVLRVLPESFQETWRDNPDVLLYLSDLGGLGIQHLNHEPEKLTEQKVALLEQTQDLAFHNYKTFIQAAECSHKIFQDFNIIETRLNLLLDKLPNFSSKCSTFAKDSQKISARWHQASSTLSKHPQLLEFLEMPQLMDNYVKNGYYDEALELSTYVKRLEKKHSDIFLIKSIVEDVKVSVTSMLNHLLSRLRTNIQLPECLKVVGYLRRMDAFNEYELRIKFLQARDTWFQKVIADIDKSNPYDHVMKVIESSRVHLFDITTQYRAIFSDEDPLLLVREDLKGNCAIFQSWITWKIQTFLRILKSDISSNLGGRVDSVLAQCMYFGLSFSRVGIDFRPLLVPLFQSVSLQKFCSNLEALTFKCEKCFEAHDFSTYTNTLFLVTNTAEESLQPPLGLLDFYPLAQYCNDILGALNELKLCCSFAIASDVTSALSKSLNRFVNTIVSYHSKQLRNMSDVELNNFNKFCFLILSDLIPHFNKCLACLFPPENISQVLGITTLEFKKFEYKLDSKNITQSLETILPTKDDLGIMFTVKSIDEPQETTRKSSKGFENFSKDQEDQKNSENFSKNQGDQRNNENFPKDRGGQKGSENEALPNTSGNSDCVSDEVEKNLKGVIDYDSITTQETLIVDNSMSSNIEDPNSVTSVDESNIYDPNHLTNADVTNIADPNYVTNVNIEDPNSLTNA
ncbi:conserved oligomeric Golgi complex subunit 8 [Parasteatoda tepidariorum]|uniref:conserved oligomeric Golgi complex subunit 8 n=1 Tax=Parasteatoda tepidariorum TaxID=114398 RepID=UPI00077FA85D|nr:conserved oligomeric Golgi complex subunit 8 [Parasteatoda tepidariorum]